MSGRGISILCSIAVLALLPATLTAERRDDVLDRFASITGALSDDNAAEALKWFDPAMPDYEKLKTQIYALLDQASVGSSVELVSETGDDKQSTVELDWYLEIRSKQPGGPVERRREVVRCRLQKLKKDWKVISLEPLSFFATPHFS